MINSNEVYQDWQSIRRTLADLDSAVSNLMKKIIKPEIKSEIYYSTNGLSPDDSILTPRSGDVVCNNPNIKEK